MRTVKLPGHCWCAPTRTAACALPDRGQKCTRHPLALPGHSNVARTSTIDRANQPSDAQTPALLQQIKAIA